MDIKLVRIDDRLIHGQVAIVWSRESGANRIIVVSDEVAEDKIRSTLVKQAAPPGIKVNVLDIGKAVRVFNNPKYEQEKVFYLFTKPQDIVQMLEEGVPIKEVNVGGMQYKNGKKQINKAVSVDDADIQAFYKLDDLGVKLDGRVVATDPKNDFIKILKESI